MVELKGDCFIVDAKLIICRKCFNLRY